MSLSNVTPSFILYFFILSLSNDAIDGDFT